MGKNQKNLGFTRSTPWLKANENYKNYAVDVQENDPNSMLNLTRKLIMEKKSLPKFKQNGSWARHSEGVDSGSDIFC